MRRNDDVRMEKLVMELRLVHPDRTPVDLFVIVARTWIAEREVRRHPPQFPLFTFGKALGLDNTVIVSERMKADRYHMQLRRAALGTAGKVYRRTRYVLQIDGQYKIVER